MYFTELENIHVLSAKKRSKHKKAHYTFSMTKKNFSENSDQVLGKLISNVWGTKFTLYSKGKSVIDSNFESLNSLELEF